MSVTEELVLKQIQDGNFENFKVLIDAYETPIRRYIRRFVGDMDDTEDIVQEVFIKAYVNIRSFEARGKISSWLYRIAHNEAINHLRKERPSSFSFIDLETILPFVEAKEDAHSEGEKNATKKILDQLLSEIDSKHREVLVLYFYEELSYKEISRVLRVPVSAVGVRISRAKEKIAACAKSKGLEYS